MKVVTVNWVNKIYSTGKIISSIEKYAQKRNIEFLHCYEWGDKPINKNEYQITPALLYKFIYMISLVTGCRYGTGFITTYSLCKKISEFNPDIVHIHCPNARSINIYMLLYYLKKKRYCTVITNHAEFFFTGNCAHAFECEGYSSGCKLCGNLRNAEVHFRIQARRAWKKMYDAIRDNERITMVMVSPWAKKRAEKSPIFSGKDIRVIGNGIDTSIFRPNEYKENSQKSVIHVTSNFSDDINDSKGGRYIIELAELLGDINFVVVGVVGKIQTKIPPNMILKGEIKNQYELAKLYSMADVGVMVSRRETFGMTYVESMCCGTPVVGFKNGGTESIALEEYSEFIEYGDVETLAKTIENWIDRKANLKEKLAKEAHARYSEQKMSEQYINLYYEVNDKLL